MCVAMHVLLFLGTFVMLCDFHRMQAWNRFLVKTENGIPKDVAIKIKQSHLIPMSRSISPDDFEKRKKALQESPEWKTYPKLKEYIQNYWLKDDVYKVGMAVLVLPSRIYYLYGLSTTYIHTTTCSTVIVSGYTFSQQ